MSSNGPLPPIQSIMNAECPYCHQRYAKSNGRHRYCQCRCDENNRLPAIQSISIAENTPATTGSSRTGHAQDYPFSPVSNSPSPSESDWTVASSRNSSVGLPMSMTADSKHESSRGGTGSRPTSRSTDSCDQCGQIKCTDDAHRKVRKNLKECDNRRNFRSNTQMKQDAISSFCGFGGGKGQSKSNGRSSGLTKTKPDIEFSFLTVALRLLQREYEQCSQIPGGLEQMRARHTNWCKEAREVGDPRASTHLMPFSDDVQCYSEGKEANCKAHGGQLRWEACRAEHAQATFDRRKALQGKSGMRHGGTDKRIGRQ